MNGAPVFRGGFKMRRGGRAPLISLSPLFLQSIAICNHLEELQTMLFKVEPIINNAPLIYVYLNTIETCLTPNLFFFVRQLLQSSNTTSTVAENLTVRESN